MDEQKRGHMPWVQELLAHLYAVKYNVLYFMWRYLHHLESFLKHMTRIGGANDSLKVLKGYTLLFGNSSQGT